jgi:hypothetical protein
MDKFKSSLHWSTLRTTHPAAGFVADDGLIVWPQ